MTAVVAVANNQGSLKSWEEVCRFENDELLFSLERKLKIGRAESIELFTDLKHYLWLSALRVTQFQEGQAPTPVLKIDQDLWLVDEAWHLFLQFTREYQDFCSQYLGFFLHHEPVTELERENNRLAFSRDPEGYELIKRLEFKEMLSWIYDHGGPDTVKRWFLKKQYQQSESKIKLSSEMS